MTRGVEGWFARTAGPVVALFLSLAPVTAQADLMEEAQRQMSLARKDLDDGNYERAVNSASSALRLNPLLYDGLVIKALAYEKLNESMLAYSLLVTYQELTRGMEQHPEVEPALGRLRNLIGSVAETMTSTPPPPKPVSDEVSASEVVAEDPRPAPEEKPAGTEPALPEREEGDPLAVVTAAAEPQPAAQFEILSRRNQKDLYDQLNESMEAGPAYVRFRSQSRSKGDDFTFGLAEVEWKRGRVDVEERVFTVILDSDKLVTKARGSGTLRFTEQASEHEVQLWYDGTRVGARVDGAAFGPFPAHPKRNAAQWFLSLEDEARAWDLEVWPWNGDLSGGGVPTGAEGRSFESTRMRFIEYSLPLTVTEESRATGLPSTVDAAEVRVSFSVTCSEKSTVTVRLEDGREVVLGRETSVRGAAKLEKSKVGLQCRSEREEVLLTFASDGGVKGSVRGEPFRAGYPGHRLESEPEIRVKGETARVEDIVYSIGAREKGRRVFRAERTE